MRIRSGNCSRLNTSPAPNGRPTAGPAKLLRSRCLGGEALADGAINLLYTASEWRPCRSANARVAMSKTANGNFSPKSFLAKVGEGRSKAKYTNGQTIFAQGDIADAVFYIQSGRVKLIVVSRQGKEAVVALLSAEDFFGEGCLTTQTRRMSTAVATGPATIIRLEKAAILEVLRREPAFSELFIKHLLERAIRVEADLVDQLFNSSEKRLARSPASPGQFRQGGEAGRDAREDQSGDSGPDGRHHSRPHKFLHEQVPAVGVHSV